MAFSNFLTLTWNLFYFQRYNFHCILCCAQLRSILCSPMDCSQPGSSVHGIFQARILEWVAFPTPGDLSDLGIEPVSLVLAAHLHWQEDSITSNWILHKLNCQGKHTDWNRPPWPGTIVTICMSCFMTGDPDKEYGTNKPPPTRKSSGKVKRRHCLSTSQNPSCQHPSWLSDACATRKDSELEWLAKDYLETNSITIKPKTASHSTEQFSWVPLPSCSPPGCPFPIKSLALSAHVSPRTIHFRVLDKSPVLGPGRGPPSCNKTIIVFYMEKEKLKLYCPYVCLVSHYHFTHNSW